MTDPTAADIAAGALAATAAPTAADTADAMAQLADVAGHASTAAVQLPAQQPRRAPTSTRR